MEVPQGSRGEADWGNSSPSTAPVVSRLFPLAVQMPQPSNTHKPPAAQLPSPAVSTDQGGRWKLLHDAWVELQVLAHRCAAVRQVAAVRGVRKGGAGRVGWVPDTTLEHQTLQASSCSLQKAAGVLAPQQWQPRSIRPREQAGAARHHATTHVLSRKDA